MLHQIIDEFYMLATVVACEQAALYTKADDIESYADQILMLVDNLELRQRLVTLGYRRMEEEFTWELQETQLLNIYEYVSLPCITKVSYKWQKRGI